jgi:hypothetical protein
MREQRNRFRRQLAHYGPFEHRALRSGVRERNPRRGRLLPADYGGEAMDLVVA